MSVSPPDGPLANTPLGRSLADRYTVLRELGAGGMATVYLAEDLRHRRKVAIKVVHAELSAVIGSERFLKEIELTANLQHPHILPLFDSGDVTGQLYYVMPFVEGETLRARLDREQQLPVADAVRIAREIADALAYAHKRGVVHRDIKPENVLLQDGHALVADFGIALAVQQAGAGRLTQTGLSLGTPQYMSPEQAMGERTIDQRTDIYALGAVTYEMIAGEPPFTGPTAQAIIARAMTERPRTLTGMRASLPAGVNTAVQIALAKLPADRYSTAAEFADALVSADPVSLSASDGVQRSRVRTYAIPLAMLVVGGLLGSALMARRGAGRNGTADETPQFFSITVPDSAPIITQHDSYDQQVRAFDISPDGRSVAWSSTRAGAPIIWQARTDLGTVAMVPGTAGGMIPTYSPDGRALAFAVSGEGVRKVDLGSGSVSSVASRRLVDQITWITREQVITSDYTGCLGTAPASGGDLVAFPSRLCTLATGGVARGPDDNHLIASLGGAVDLLDVHSGKTIALRPPTRAGTSDDQANVPGEVPFLLDPRTLLFVRDSTLYAAHFDPAKARLTSDPVSIVTGIRHEAGTGVVQLAYSAGGTFAWLAGSDASVSRFVLVSPHGGPVDTLPVPPANVNSYALSTDGNRLAYTITLPGNATVVRILDRRRNVTDSAQFPIDLQVLNWVDADSALSMISVAIRRDVVVRDLGGRMRLDSSAARYQASSRDGRMRCGVNGTFWNVAAPRDTIRFDRRGNWCRFSPDARHLSWDEQSTGAFVAPTTRNAAAARQRIAPVGANEARWSADGREVLYRMGNRWYAVPSQPPQNGSLATPRLVLEGTYNQAYASWELAPDGRLLLLQGTPPKPATHVNVITNFPRYVAEKLAAATH